jgi:hypothetical protein
MAGPTEVELLRQATQLQMQCSGYLGKLLKSAEEVLAWPDLEDFGSWGKALAAKGRLTDQNERTEEKVVKYAKVWEPEAAHTLAVLAHQLGHVGYHHLYEVHQSGREMLGTLTCRLSS